MRRIFMINLEVFFNGLILGSLYGLMSGGYSLIYGVGKVSNLAYGHMYIASTFLAYMLYKQFQSLLVVVPVVLFLTFLLGVATQYLLELVSEDHSRVLFLSLGIAIILENLLLAYFGGIYRFSPRYISGLIEFAGIRLDIYRVITFAVTISLYILMSLLVTKTQFGTEMRAVSQNEDASWLMGINVQRVKLLTGGIAAGLAGVAAILLLPIYPIYPAMGWEYLLVGFAIVIVGGLGSLNGTLIAGVILGAAESLFGYYVSSGLRGVFYFSIVVVVLLIRPQGILGKKRGYK